MFGLNKYVIYGIAAFIIIGAFTTFVMMWKHEIETAAKLEFNNRQLQITLEEQTKHIEEMNQLAVDKDIIIKKMSDDNNILSTRVVNIQNYLNSEEAKKNDRKASIILKNTVRKLMESQ